MQPAPLIHDRDTMEKLLQDLREVCDEKEEMYKDTVADLKQSLIDENSLIPGSNVNETAFLPMDEVLKGMYGVHFKIKKANDRVICESISAYSIYLRNISTVVERMF